MVAEEQGYGRHAASSDSNTHLHDTHDKHLQSIKAKVRVVVVQDDFVVDAQR